MTESSWLEKAERLEIQAYQRKRDWKSLKTGCVAFTGSPRKHPHDTSRIILVVDPFSTQAFYYEFRTEDILYAEELPSIGREDGETVTMARIWVRKMSIGVRFTPFLVADVDRP
jgi:inorganic pyrophosphatase